MSCGFASWTRYSELQKSLRWDEVTTRGGCTDWGLLRDEFSTIWWCYQRGGFSEKRLLRDDVVTSRGLFLMDFGRGGLFREVEDCHEIMLLREGIAPVGGCNERGLLREGLLQGCQYERICGVSNIRFQHPSLLRVNGHRPLEWNVESSAHFLPTPVQYQSLFVYTRSISTPATLPPLRVLYVTRAANNKPCCHLFLHYSTMSTLSCQVCSHS